MTKSHSDMSEGYSITVKLSPFLEKYVKTRGDFLGQSYKSVVIDAITRMAETDALPYQNSTKSTIELTPDSAPNPFMTPVPVHAVVERNDTKSTPDSTVDLVLNHPPSRALNKIYIINNKNNIEIFNESLREVWEEFVQFRKEQRKPIKPTQMKKLWTKFEKIIEENGVDGLIASINQTIERGYQGVFPVTEQVVNNDNTTHRAEDF